jgi:uncharacterized protein (TIGR00297 family)
MVARPYAERSRKAVHIAMGGFALALRWFTWWQAALLAAAALAFNLHVLHRLASHLYRPGEITGSARSGIVLYPFAILALILVFPFRLDIAGAAWAILAVGDGMATLVGTTVRSNRIPWNREKSVAGSVAFFISGAAAGTFVAWWCRPNVTPEPDLWFSLGAPTSAALAAAFVETIPSRLDDNVSVPASAAAVLWALTFVEPVLVGPAAQAAAYAFGPAVLVNVTVASLGYKARTVNLSGAIAGTIIGVLIAVTTGAFGWALLMATFLAASITSRLGLRRKTLLGINEERGGRRGAGNAIANTGVALVASMLSVVIASPELALLAFATALAAGGSDTVASEIGKAWGKRTYLITTLGRVPPGTSGAVSVEGTVAGIAGAFVLGGAAVAFGLIPSGALLPVVFGATIGSLFESLLGATLEGPGILNNDMLNFLNTAIAAGVAIVLAGLML